MTGEGFIIVPPRDYVRELLRLAPRFAASEEFQSLDEEDRRCAGLVFAAFAKFFEACFADKDTVEECREAIEHFARSDDPEAHDLLITGVFEAFRFPRRSASLLLPVSRALYRRWIGD